MQPIEASNVPEHVKSFGVVTKTGNFLSPAEVTGQFAAGQRSKQLTEVDSFGDKYEMNNLSMPPFSPESLVNLLSINTYHFRACQTKATDAAGSGWHVRPSTKKSVDKNLKIVEDFFHGLETSVVQTLRDALFDYEALGWGAIEVIRENDSPDGEIIDLKHIPAHTLRVHRSRQKYAQKRGLRTVWFKDISTNFEVDYETGRNSTATLKGKTRANELMFFKQYTQLSDFYGRPQIISALGAMLGDFEREEYNTSFFANQGVPAYAVFITGDYDPGPVDDAGRTDLEKVIQKHLGELAGNPHATLLLTIPSARRRDGSPGRVEVIFQKLSEEVKEASFEKYRIANRNEVLAAHGVPTYRLGISETGALGGNSANESNEIYKRSQIDPIQELIETAFNRWIVEEELGIEDSVWQLDDLDTKDEEHDIRVATQLFAMGMMTPNDGIRHFGKKFGLTPVTGVEELDHHYIGGGDVELGLAKDPASTQGQRPADEETDGMDARGERPGGGATESLRQYLETSDLPDEVRTALTSMVNSERS